MALVIYKGAVAPECLCFTVTGTGMLTVLSATIHWRKLAGASGTWTVTNLVRTVTNITLTYPFLAGDTDTLGDYNAQAFLVVPGGVIRSAPVAFTIAEALP